MENDDFKQSDLNHPLYEFSQVVTDFELIQIYTMIRQDRDICKWYQFKLKNDLQVAENVLVNIINWLRKGKPAHEGEHNEETHN